MLEKLSQAIKQVQEPILAIKLFNHHRSWKYKVYNGDYPSVYIHLAKVIACIYMYNNRICCFNTRGNRRG